ncbi:MAG: glycosyltransferase [Thiotrichaceae bacterium]
MDKLRLLLRKAIPSTIHRPLADRVYKILAWGKRTLYRLQSRISIPAKPNIRVFANLKTTLHPRKPQLRSQILVSRITKPIVRLYFTIQRLGYKLKATGYRFLKTRLAQLWRGASKHRHLFGKTPDNLDFFQRMQRFALTILFTLPDWRYQRSLIHFEKNLSKLPTMQSKQAHNGLLMMIGTLGPGGSERQAMLTLTSLLKQSDMPMQLICVFLRSEAQRFYLPQLESASIPVSELDRDTSDDYSYKIRDIFQACQTLPTSLIETTDYVRTLNKRNPSVVHLWLDEVNIKGGIAAVALGIPRIILGMRSLPPIHFQLHQPYMREGYRWLAKQKNVLMINNSTAGAHAYEKWLGLPTGHIRVLYNGFDFDTKSLTRYRANRLTYRSRHHIEGDVKLLGTVIRLSEEKRPMLWLEIAAKVRRKIPNVHFLIVGDGPLRNELEARTTHNDLKGAVHFTGYEKDVLAAMAAMDLFLLTSHSEGLPNVLVEAQALGVPVVTTDVGGAKETLSHEKTGWVLESDNIQDAADIIVKLLHDKAWLKEAAYEAPAYVKNKFSLTKMLDKTLAIYGETAYPNKVPGVHCEASS